MPIVPTRFIPSEQRADVLPELLGWLFQLGSGLSGLLFLKFAFLHFQALNIIRFYIQACSACPEGTFSDAAGSTVCTACQPGTSSAQSAQSQCTACPVGSFSDIAGSLQCTPCAVGTYANGTSSVRCQQCLAGSFQGKSGQDSCQPCLAGQAQSSPGQVPFFSSICFTNTPDSCPIIDF